MEEGNVRILFVPYMVTLKDVHKITGKNPKEMATRVGKFPDPPGIYVDSVVLNERDAKKFEGPSWKGSFERKEPINR